MPDRSNTPAAETDGGADGMNTALMRSLKIALVVMGLFIAAGFSLIGYEVYRRATDADYSASRAAARGPEPAVLAPGSRIESLTAVGNRLAVLAIEPDSTQVLILVDPSDAEAVEVLRAPGR